MKRIYRNFHASSRLLMKRDAYTVLGVGKQSSPGEIKKSYYELARKFHPDTNKASFLYLTSNRTLVQRKSLLRSKKPMKSFRTSKSDRITTNLAMPANSPRLVLAGLVTLVAVVSLDTQTPMTFSVIFFVSFPGEAALVSISSDSLWAAICRPLSAYPFLRL